MSNFAWAEKILKQYWGYDSFRGIQREIIESIAQRRDTLGLMPTGGGKSITFQVPALATEGLCLVITPLIALMKDQVAHLRRRGITVAAIYSGQSRDEILRHLDNAVLGAYKFLYVSPERLATDIFLVKLRKMQISFITVDEAHCISQWGYDFRPSYLRIAEIRKVIPDVPVLALTATATGRVVDDICKHLSCVEQKETSPFAVFRMSFARPNLHYVVRKTDDKIQELLHILRSVEGSAIVYTRNRRGTREVCEVLKQEGISALYYHAGLTDIDKDVWQASWGEGDVRVMVATNAFGMGIDKSDVRLVVHMDLPDSVEAYFQEAGRGGRDGRSAWAVMLYNRHDRTKLLRRIPENFPEKEYVRRVYESLAYFFQLAVGDGYNVTYEFSLEKFCHHFKFFPTQALSAIHILEHCGYIAHRDEEESTSRVLFIMQRDELYHLHRLGANADAVIRALLRHYCGLFSDYVFIEEARIAHECGLSENDVYETLVALNRMRIVHYIPRKRAAYITYLTRRVESERLHISAEAYELRLQQFRERIQAILDYVENDDFCRSRFLLEYFDDRTGKDCGFCDVCLQQETPSESQVKQLVKRFLDVLKDGQPHPPSHFQYDGFTTEARLQALRQLMADERIIFEDGYYKIVR